MFRELNRGLLIRTLWHFANALFLQNPLNPSSRLKVIILRLFGARIGQGVVLKPSINVKYPWNLTIGDYSWVGENTWLDSLAPITIGRSACISQGVYCCTGNHDWSDPAFGLVVKPIVIEDGAWVGGAGHGIAGGDGQEPLHHRCRDGHRQGYRAVYDLCRKSGGCG